MSQNTGNTIDGIRRPTSRVMHPPGGNCSDIFGTGPPVAPPTNHRSTRTGRANEQSYDIFGAPIRHAPAPVVAAAPAPAAAPAQAPAPTAAPVNPPTNGVS